MSVSAVVSIVTTISFQVMLGVACDIYITDWRWWLVSGLFIVYGASRSHEATDRAIEIIRDTGKVTRT